MCSARHVFFTAIVSSILLLGLPTSVDAATVFVDKLCYGVQNQDLITVNFEDVQGIGVWIGLYPRNLVSDFNNLPAFGSGALTSWILTCGRRDTCDDQGWPTRGVVQFAATDVLDPNQEFVVVVSGDRAGLAAQAVTATFQVVTDSSGCPSEVAPTEAPIVPFPVSSVAVTAPQPEETISSVIVVSEDVLNAVAEARGQLDALIRSDSDLIGKVCVLQEWHVCLPNCVLAFIRTYIMTCDH